MKIISSIIVCGLSTALVSADQSHRYLRPQERTLQVPSFTVETPTVSGQTITFGTGIGAGDGNSHVKVKVMDLCRKESATRIDAGFLYPGPSSVPGMVSDTSKVVQDPGTGNSLSFDFVEGIAENADIYTGNGDGTAKVSFCIEVGLYATDMLVNFKEVKVKYNVNLTTKAATLQP